MQSSYKQVYFAFLLAVGIYVFSANKSNDLLLYTFAPLAILGANMFEKMENSIYSNFNYPTFCPDLGDFRHKTR